ncbi:MAG: ABC transporter substrate-binding protein [Proteobacteria bacterium]|nr:ABC transporter substrate-binding protein [Burkholderiales bacterium]
MHASKRQVLAVAAVLFAAVVVAPGAFAQGKVPIRFQLDWVWQGPHAFFLLAQDRGYFAKEGLDVTFDQGKGSGVAVNSVASGVYDGGFGDTNALIRLAAQKPGEQPVAVYMLYNRAPFVIATLTSSGIKTPRDLEGRSLGAPAGDAALGLLPVFAKANGIDATKIKITNMAPNLREPMLQKKEVDAVAGFINTIWFAAMAVGLNPDKDLTIFRYGDMGVAGYGNSILFTQKFVKEQPEAVRGFLRALTRGVQDVLANPEAGIDAVMKRDALLNRDNQRERLLAAIKNDVLSPEVTKIGLGDVLDDRFGRGIAQQVEAAGLPRAPTQAEIFNRSFLPVRDQRAVK